VSPGASLLKDRGTEGGLWTPDAIVKLAQRHMGSASSVFYAPSIPHKKLGKARAVHALHLTDDDPILVLYDDTLFGGAEIVRPVAQLLQGIVEEAQGV